MWNEVEDAPLDEPQYHATKTRQNHGIGECVVQQFGERKITAMEDNGEDPSVDADL